MTAAAMMGSVGMSAPAAASSYSSWGLRAEFFDIKLCGQAGLYDTAAGKKASQGQTKTVMSTGDCSTGIYGGVDNTMSVSVVMQKWTGSAWVNCKNPHVTVSNGTSSAMFGYADGPNGACSGVNGIYRTLTSHGGYVWGVWKSENDYPIMNSGWESGIAY